MVSTSWPPRLRVGVHSETAQPVRHQERVSHGLRRMENMNANAKPNGPHLHGPQQWDVFDVSLELIRALRAPLLRITTVDASLTTQIRRAASSISLNLSEGRRRAGRDRIHAWRIAAGSAEEVRASLLVADAWGYVDGAVLAASLALL